MKKILLLVVTILVAHLVQAQCPPNTPKKLMASAFHASVLITNTGDVRYWGQDASQSLSGTPLASTNVLAPLSLSGYTGTPLCVAAGSPGVREPQLYLLTTTNLYGWGHSNGTIGTSPSTSGDIALTAMTLPTGVTVGMINFIEASLGGIAIVTNNGAVYVKQGGTTGGGTALVYGDGTTGTSFDGAWHKVRTSAAAADTLTGVVELSYGGRGIMALTGTGTVYAWGNNINLGSGGGVDRAYASVVTKPVGVTANKIEMITKATYDVTAATGSLISAQFILGTDGKLYGIGEGKSGVLGQGNETDATSWVTVKGPGGTGELSNIVQINSNNPLVWSSGVGTGAHYSMGALSSSGNLYLWGDNARRMVGTDTLFNVDSNFYTVARIPPNFAINNAAIGYFEMGGHTTAAFLTGSSKFCYVGHKVNGSMGDGVDSDNERWSFDCINTPEEYICPATPITGCPLPTASDLFASSNHGSLITNGTPNVIMWGQASSSAEPGQNLMTPKTLFEYNGNPLGVAAGGVSEAVDAQGSQMWVHTTAGLWAWGYSANTISAGRAGSMPITSVALPSGVTASQISFIRASKGGVALVTTSGTVYIRAGAGSACSPAVYGDGSVALDAAGSTVWHQVTTAVATPLTGVTQLNFGGTVAMAITPSGAYVWGVNTYNGDGITAATTRTRATLMTLHSDFTAVGSTIKPRSTEIIQSGSNQSVQFILGTNNRVYSLGRNLDGALGNGTASTAAITTSWNLLSLVGIKKLASNNSSVQSFYSVGAMDLLGNVRLWGSNDNGIIGLGATTNTPTPVVASTVAANDAADFEIGGHQTIIFAKSTSRFYFSGHASGGSRGVGTADTSANVFTLSASITNCANTAFSISGNLYQDNNGLTDNLVNGTAISSLSGVTLKANLLDENGYVIATQPISSGTYSFTGIQIGNYKIQISPVAGTVFSLAPASILPYGYFYSGDQAGTGIGVGIDAIANGIQSVSLASSKSNINFGVSPLPPVANNITAPRMNSSNSSVSIPSLQASSPSGTAISSYKVTTLPSALEGILYYCTTGTIPTCTGTLTAVTTAMNLTPVQAASLYFDPVQTFMSNATFTYTATDANGLLSNTANYTIPVYNNPPVTMDVTASAMKNTNAATELPSLIAADVDGTVSTYSITSVPAAAGVGVLTYCSTGDEPCTGTVTTITTAVSGLTAAQMTTLKFDPDPAYTGTYTFNYTATDNNTNVSNTSKFNIPVIAPPTSAIPGNLPPVASNIVAQNINNSSAATPIPNLSAIDPDGKVANYTIGATIPNSVTEGVLSYCSTGTLPSCTATPVTAGMTLTPAQAATLRFDPVASFIGTASFTYTATDNYGIPLTSNVATYQIPVVNQPPVANPDRVAPIANTLLTPTRLPSLSGSDYDGTIAGYTITSLPASTSGTLQYCVTGSMPGCTLGTIASGSIPLSLTPTQAATLNFIPNSGFTGDYVFNFTTTDNNGLISQAAPFTVPVVAAAVTTGEPPIAFSFNAPAISSAAGATTLTGALTGVDPDGTIASYTVRSITSANEGTLTYCTTPPSTGCGTAVTVGLTLTPLQAATIAFTPNANFKGTTTFTYTNLDNSNNLSNTATVTIPVINNPPVAQNINNNPIAKTAGATTLNPLTSTDADGTVVSYKILTIPTPDQGVLRVCTTAPGTGCTAVTAGDVLTPTQVAQLAFTPNPTGTSPVVTFLYSSLDNSGNTGNVAAASMSLYDPLLLPPVANNITAPRMNSSNSSVSIPSLQASSPSGTAISSYKVTALPSALEGILYYCTTGTIPTCTGTLTAVTTAMNLTPVQAASLYFDPVQTFTGNSTFTYTATDANGLLSNTANYTVPIFNNPPVTMNVVTAESIDTTDRIRIPPLVAADNDGTIASYTVSSIPSATQGVLTYCSSGVFPCAGTTVTITTTTVLTPAQMATMAIDPTLGFAGNYMFNYIATDNNGNTSNSSSYTIPVVSTAPMTLNQPPVATNIVAQNINNTAAATAIPFLVGTDPDGVVVSYTIGATIPNSVTEGVLSYCSTGTLPSCTATPVTAGMSLTPAQAATLRFDPVASFIGTASFTYTATDNAGTPLTSAPATYQIPIVNQPPVANPDRVAPIANTVTTPTRLSPLTGNDFDGTITGFTITSLPATTSGTLQYCVTGSMPGCTLSTIASGSIPLSLTPTQAATLNFIPNSGFTGDYVFNFTTTDNNAQVSAPATFTVPVVAFDIVPGEPPIVFSFNAPAISSAAGATTLTGALTGVDPDGTIASYNVTSITPANEGILTYCTTPPSTGCSTAVTVGLSLTPAQAATVAFAPNANFKGSATFTYTNFDNDGNLSNLATVTIPVINNPPVAQTLNNPAITRTSPATPLVPLSSTDADGTVVSYVIQSIPSPEQGVLSVCTTAPSTGCTPVTVGMVLTPAQSAQLAFTPNVTLNSPIITFLYSSIDNSNNISNIAAVNIPISNADPLPTNLITFTAKKNGSNNALVEWVTGVEEIGVQYLLQHSTNGQNWTLINTQNANSLNAKHYSYLHNNLASGNHYYRLKVLDIDQSQAYSPVRTVSIISGNNYSISIYPNPVSSNFTVSTSDASVVSELIIVDNFGKQLQVLTQVVSGTVINMENYESGLYFIKIIDKNGEAQTIKVTKN